MPSIGKPIANTRIYILDKRREPVPVGVGGEIYIGGVGVARGYLNREELTAERFVEDRFAGEAGGRMYRTGDLGRWRADGNIEFLGRNDFQVKIRGFRIELGEIEARLAEYPGIKDAVVIAREDTAGDKRLVAYVTSRQASEESKAEAGKETQAGTIQAEELRAHLAGRLPEYMVPAAYVELKRLPLTANGKLDRKALPAPDAGAYATRGYEEPQGEMETGLAAIWRELLKVERVGRQDNFFSLGGHSLLAVRVISRIRQELKKEIGIRELFARPVLRDFAESAEKAGRAVLPEIERGRGREEELPLSYAQQRLWFLAQMGGVSEAYHIPLGLRLQGKLDRGALRRALDRIVERHEALRTVFAFVNEQAVQRIVSAEESRFALVEEELGEKEFEREGGEGEEGRERELKRRMEEEARERFDLERGPLIRGRLIGCGEEEHVLLITMHHIVSDGWSMGVLVDELSRLYKAYVEGAEDPLPELGVQYGDYAVWQRKWMRGGSGGGIEEQGEYWKKELRGAAGLLELPWDHARPAQQEHAGGWMEVELGEKLSEGLREVSRRHGMTLYMTLLAGWGGLLGRLSGQEEVVIGTPVANRGRAEIEGLIGFFVNTLAMRVELGGRPRVGELLERVKGKALEAQQNQDIPFEQVVELVQPERSLGHSPLFQVMFVWQNAPKEGLELAGLELRVMKGTGKRLAKFDMTLTLQEAGDGKRIVGGVEYATALFERATVERYVGYFRTLLEGMVANENETIEGLRILPEKEREQLLYGWNETKREYRSNRCVHELFEEQVERAGEATALVFEEQELSYGELNRRANQVAHYLRRLGVKPDTRVAICVERGVEMIVGLLGILKAGGAYVPLDPGYPVERLRYMLEDSGPVALLTQAGQREILGELNGTVPVIDVEAESGVWGEEPETNLDRESLGLNSRHLAYVIYTSGSTGKPKGVMVEHHNLSGYLLWSEEAYYREPGSGSPAIHSIGFDGLVTTLYGPLVSGQRLTLPRQGNEMDVMAEGSGESQPYTLIKLTPAHLKVLNQTIAPGERRIPTRTLMIGGGSPGAGGCCFVAAAVP